jgi:protein-tyrosine phosphatase
MKYGIFFALVATLLLIYAVTSGRWSLLLLWPALSCGLVSAAYLRFGHRIFGKRLDGSMACASVTLLLPYLLLVWAVWHIIRCVSREPHCNRLADGITIGRRLLSHELPPDVDTVVDLTCEFPEPAALRAVPQYISFPLLDAGALSPESLADFSRRLAGIDGSLFIHCAQGHGRAGLISALLLIARGLATDGDDAIRQIQMSRPSVDLNRIQTSALNAAAGLLHATD